MSNKISSLHRTTMMRTEMRPATVAVNPNSPLATFRISCSVMDGMGLENLVNNDELLICNRVVARKPYEQSATRLYNQKS
jgi:hypothetical protein